MAEWNHWVYTPLAQRKMQFGTYAPFKRTAVFNAAKRNAQNVLIQSTASTLGLLSFARLGKGVKKIGGRAICTVYDSIELEVPIHRASEALELAFQCMDDWPVEHFDFLDLPIGTDAEIGFDWGTIKELHRGATQDEIIGVLREIDAAKCQETLEYRPAA